MTSSVATPPEALLTFDGEMTIYTAAEQFQRLQQHLNTHASLVLDLSGVTELDSAGLQLLLLAQTEATRRGLLFRLQHPSATVQEVLQLLRLDRTLMPPTAASQRGS